VGHGRLLSHTTRMWRSHVVFEIERPKPLARVSAIPYADSPYLRSLSDQQCLGTFSNITVFGRAAGSGSVIGGVRLLVDNGSPVSRASDRTLVEHARNKSRARGASAERSVECSRNWQICQQIRVDNHHEVNYQNVCDADLAEDQLPVGSMARTYFSARSQLYGFCGVPRCAAGGLIPQAGGILRRGGSHDSLTNCQAGSSVRSTSNLLGVKHFPTYFTRSLPPTSPRYLARGRVNEQAKLKSC